MLGHFTMTFKIEKFGDVLSVFMKVNKTVLLLFNVTLLSANHVNILF